MRALTVFLFLFLYAEALQANHIKALGYEINYSAFLAEQIDKDLLIRHQLGFSKKDLVVNINISPNRESEEVLLIGSAKNLLGTTTEMSFKRILERGSAKYQLTLRIEIYSHWPQTKTMELQLWFVLEMVE